MVLRERLRNRSAAVVLLKAKIAPRMLDALGL